MSTRGKFKPPAAKAGQHFKPPSTDTKPKPEPKSWRVEATVPAIQHVEAATKEEAIEIACRNPEEWEVDLNAPICAEHVVDVEDEDEDE